MISKILIGVILSMGISFQLFYQSIHKPLVNEVTQQKILLATQEVRQQEQIRTIEELQNNFVKTTETLQEQTRRNSEIEGELARYLDIFRRHNLSKLAAAKPGLIQNRINKGTKDVFDSIENDSTFIDNLDN
jgi:hypothetical protein